MRCATGRCSSTASSRHAPCPTPTLPREALLELADRVRRWHARAAARRRRARGRARRGARAPLGRPRHGRRLRSARPCLDTRDVRRPRRRRRGSRESSCARLRPVQASLPRRPSCSASRRCGRSAVRRRSAGSRTSSVSTRSSARERVRERGEARGLARRRDRPARPVRRRWWCSATAIPAWSSSSWRRSASTATKPSARRGATLAAAEAIARA